MGVGQPVFGIPMSGTTGTNIVWCAPTQKPGTAHWSTVCFPPDAAGARYQWLDIVYPPLFPLSLRWMSSNPFASSAPTVETGPAALPSMTLTVKLGGVKPPAPGTTGNPIYTLAVGLDWGEGPNALPPLRVPLGARGVRFRLLGGELQLTPGTTPETLTVTILQPLGATGALPL